MATRFSIFGLRWRVVVYFAANPGVGLGADEISERFNVDVRNVKDELRELVAGGILARPYRGGGRENYAVYAAGPTLLAELGAFNQAQACAPVAMMARR